MAGNSQRDAMLAAMGVELPSVGPDGPAGMAPMAPAVSVSLDGAGERAKAFVDALGGGVRRVMAPPDPERAALYGALNPLASAGLIAAGDVASKGMGDGIGKRGLDYLTGAGTDPSVRGVGTVTPSSYQPPTDVRPMNAPQVDIQPSMTLGQMGSPARGQGGGGAGAGFGGLEKNLRDAQGRQLQGYDVERDLQRELGIDKSVRTMAVGDLEDANAARMQRDAEDQQRTDALAAQKHETFLARQETLANELATQRVDPGRLLRNADAATQMTIGLGAALGGAFGNGRNDYLDRLDKLVERDINAQIQDIDSKKSSFNARQSLFGQMLAETGDRRLAAMQTRKLMYDAMDLKLKADTERLGIPELRTNAEILAQGIQEKRATLEVQIAATALQQARAAAAAQVAADRAAQERAWQHQKDIEELKIKNREVDAKILAAGGEGGKADAAAIGETTKRLADDDIQSSKALVQSMAKNIRKDGTIVGFDKTTGAKRGAAKALGALNPATWVGNGQSDQQVDAAVLSPDEIKSRQEWDQLRLIFQKKITGAGGSPETMKQIQDAYEGAKTPEQRIAVINRLEAELNEREGLAKGNLTDSQRAEFERRMTREGIAAPKPRVK